MYKDRIRTQLQEGQAARSRGQGRGSVLRALVALAMLLAPVAPQAAPGWDIVGIRLGMTEQQARGAIKAHSAQAQIAQSTLKFTFSDGAKQQETSSFLATIAAQIPGPAGASDTERVELEFSPPPREQRVVRVRRALTTYRDPPPLQRMQESLMQKYGRPLDTRTFGIGIKNHFMSWAEAGKTICGQQAGKPIAMIGVGQSPRNLTKFRQYQQQKLAPADLSSCSGVLQVQMDYREGGTSVNTLVLQMVDYGYILPALEATAKWIADQEAEARKTRLNSGTTPKL
jgi:hypothetical protein